VRFILDENVPNSVGEMLRSRGHEVSSIRDFTAQGAPDQVVATIAEHEEAVLVSHDKDFRKIAPRVPDGQRARFRRLSIVRMQCPKPRSSERLQAAMPLIEFEFEERQRMPDRRMIVVIAKATVTVHR
jgi:predicted nuclease of predicted toxin-antitoxin system